MKKYIFLGLVAIFLISFSATAFASDPGPEFKPLDAHFDNQNTLIIEGKYFNWSDKAMVVQHEKLNVTIWGSMGMNTYPINYDKPNILLQGNEMVKYIFRTTEIPLQRIDTWTINASTDFNLK